MKKVVIICARNEEETVGDVVHAAKSARVGDVIVVDDGSSDRTAARARSAGACVVSGPQHGKGEAMLRGVEEAGSFHVAIFLDADLRGLRTQHVIKLARLSERFEHVVQLRDYGLPDAIARALPRISGERSVHATILRSVPVRWWRGFLIEQAINRTAGSMNAIEYAYVARGVGHRIKAEKRGIVHGIMEDVRMFGAIAAARLTPLTLSTDDYPVVNRQSSHLRRVA